MATVKMFSGPMFSGKTEHLIDMINTQGVYSSKYLLKSHFDNRKTDGMFISTHGNKKITCLNINEITSYDDFRNCMDVLLQKISGETRTLICIDEGQFFGKELITFLKTIIRDQKYKNVDCYIAILDMTFEKINFERYSECLEIGVTDIKLRSDCEHHDCKNNLKTAIYSKLLKNINPGDKKIFIGGHESYRSSCPECFDKTW